MSDIVKKNADLIRARTAITPAVGIVLGSGLGDFSQAVADAVAIPYGELQGFPVPGVSGHVGSLIVGRIGGLPVAVMAGRGHLYEHGRADAMRVALETMMALGVGSIILTNAGGSLREDFPPGSVMLITDHINLSGANPLIGEGSDSRFVGMSEAYDAELRRAALTAADEEGIQLHQGVYAWFSGPTFETPAEIRAARTLGADVVGMSTVPEVILGRFYGLRCAAISTITNFAAGMTGAEISHEETKALAPIGAAKLERIIRRYLRRRSRLGA